MPATITAIDPLTGSRNLIVEVHPDLGDPSPRVVRALAARFFARSVRVGLLVTPLCTLVLRNAHPGMPFDDAKYDVQRLDTQLLFQSATIGSVSSDASFVRQVTLWLEAIASSWPSFLNPSAVRVMVPDVIGGLVGADLEHWDGILDAHDAAE